MPASANVGMAPVTVRLQDCCSTAIMRQPNATSYLVLTILLSVSICSLHCQQYMTEGSMLAEGTAAAPAKPLLQHSDYSPGPGDTGYNDAGKPGATGSCKPLLPIAIFDGLNDQLQLRQQDCLRPYQDTLLRALQLMWAVTRNE